MIVLLRWERGTAASWVRWSRGLASGVVAWVTMGSCRSKLLRTADAQSGDVVRRVLKNKSNVSRRGCVMSTRQWHRMVTAIAAIAMLAGQARPEAQEGEVPAGLPEAPGPPLIAAAQMSADRFRLTLSGLNFGSATPIVSLGLSALTVTAIEPASTITDPDVVTAGLPADLLPGTYLLALTRAVDGEVAIFYLAVPRVGAVYQ